MKIYTRSGDAGETGLFGGQRVKKHHPRVEAYGAIDELNAIVGMAVAALEGGFEGASPRVEEEATSSMVDALRRVQNRLFDLGADFATPPDSAAGEWLQRVVPPWTKALEAEIDAFEDELQALTTFILPGGSSASATLHLARTVCRRAERRAVEARDAGEDLNLEALRFLNRLSDWLFVAARVANARSGRADRPWQREA